MDSPSVDTRGPSEQTYAAVQSFFTALAAAGVEHVCISPGSRSTPLAICAHRTPGLDISVHLDERSAAFFGLGIAKASRRPVALVCTSGTAAANYLPAVVEAHYANVPLIVLTADRPPELRDWGGGQTIDQLRLFGDAGASHIQLVVDPITPASIEWLGDVLGALGERPGPTLCSPR